MDLQQLLGDDADVIAPALGDLLARADDGQQVADEVLELLSGSTATRIELGRLLADEQDSVRAAFPGGLPGLPAGSDATVFVCRTCGYAYPVFEVGEPVPDCPSGHGPLIVQV